MTREVDVDRWVNGSGARVQCRKPAVARVVDGGEEAGEQQPWSGKREIVDLAVDRCRPERGAAAVTESELSDLSADAVDRRETPSDVDGAVGAGLDSPDLTVDHGIERGFEGTGGRINRDQVIAGEGSPALGRD